MTEVSEHAPFDDRTHHGPRWLKSFRPWATMRRRARRGIIIAGAAYLAAVVPFHGAVAVGVVVARFQGRAPQAPVSIDIENLRRVDDRVWASGQPDARRYGELSAAGVEAIVDLRTGVADDRNEVDHAELARVGIDYVRLPVKDGHVPDDETVLHFLDVVDRHDGIVLLHCGAGVGRSSTLASGYLAHQDQRVSLWDTLALGSVTMEQAWFLVSGQRNAGIRRLSEALDAPRRGWNRFLSML
ncbi:MAG: sulfur transferase domain-containing protein [Acidimicrobiales bacterium]